MNQFKKLIELNQKVLTINDGYDYYNYYDNYYNDYYYYIFRPGDRIVNKYLK